LTKKEIRDPRQKNHEYPAKMHIGIETTGTVVNNTINRIEESVIKLVF
jgi:hypothetical protein